MLAASSGFCASGAFANGSAKPSQELFSKAFGAKRGTWVLNTFNRYRKKSLRYNQEFFVFVDLKRHKNDRRFYIVYPQTNQALGYKTAHGYASDRNGDGYVEKVGNAMNSGLSSEGVFLTQGIHASDKFGHTLHLCGLSKTNSRAKARLLRVHAALGEKGKDYVNQGLPSAGCFAVNIRAAETIINLLAKQPTLIIASLTDSFN
jgi:L,D-transpeptidase catalytic domain